MWCCSMNWCNLEPLWFSTSAPQAPTAASCPGRTCQAPGPARCNPTLPLASSMIMGTVRAGAVDISSSSQEQVPTMRCPWSGWVDRICFLGRWKRLILSGFRVCAAGLIQISLAVIFAVHITMFFNGAIPMAISPTSPVGWPSCFGTRSSGCIMCAKWILLQIAWLAEPGLCASKGSWRIFCLWWAMFRWSPAIQHNVGLFMLSTRHTGKGNGSSEVDL